VAEQFRVQSFAPRGVAIWVRETALALNEVLRRSSTVNDTVTAGSTQTQAGATVLGMGLNRVTTANANDGVKFPLPGSGDEVIIRNDSGAAIQIWPQSSGKVDDGSADAVDGNTLADNKSRTYRATDSTNWYTIGNS